MVQQIRELLYMNGGEHNGELEISPFNITFWIELLLVTTSDRVESLGRYAHSNSLNLNHIPICCENPW